MKHPMAVTSRRFATIGTRRSGRRTASQDTHLQQLIVLRENQERSAENIQSNQTLRGDIPAVSPPNRSCVVNVLRGGWVDGPMRRLMSPKHFQPQPLRKNPRRRFWKPHAHTVQRSLQAVCLPPLP